MLMEENYIKGVWKLFFFWKPLSILFNCIHRTSPKLSLPIKRWEFQMFLHSLLLNWLLYRVCFKWGGDLTFCHGSHSNSYYIHAAAVPMWPCNLTKGSLWRAMGYLTSCASPIAPWQMVPTATEFMMISLHVCPWSTDALFLDRCAVLPLPSWDQWESV